MVSKTTAQYFDTKTMSVASKSHCINNELLDWSLGEAIAIHTWTDSSKYLLSSGFLQNKNNDRALYESNHLFGEQIIAGPIPTSNLITLRSKTTGLTINGVKLYNDQGKLIAERKGIYASHNYTEAFWLNQLQNGFYYLIVYYTIAGLSNEIKIIKIIKQ